MKRIAYLDYSHIFAGAETVLYNMISHLDRKKYEPIIVFPYPMVHHERYKSLSCKMLYLADSKKWWMGSERWEKPLPGTDTIKRMEFGRRLAQLIKRKKIDILHVNLLQNNIYWWISQTVRVTDVKLVGHYRSHISEWIPSVKAQSLFDAIVCVSEYSKKIFLSKGESTRTEVLYDSIDTDAFNSELTKDEARDKIGRDKSEILITSVGQLSRHKGHDNAILAFSQVHKEFPTARLLIAGGGAQQEVDYLKVIACKLGVDDKVTIPGIQFPNIKEIYRASDLILSLTKVGEAFGLVPYEAALLGAPFIGPNMGAVKEFVTDMESGMLVDTNDVNAIAQKLHFALSHPDKCQQMVHNLNSIIQSRLLPAVQADNLEKLYSTL